MALNATLTWRSNPGNTAPGIKVTGYSVVWTQNGVALPADAIPATPFGEATGYSIDFITSTGITPAPGDVIGGSVDTVDSVDNLVSAFTPSVPATITEPTPPPPPPPTVAPLPPVSVVLTQTGP